MREQSKLLWEQEDCVTCFLPIILPHFQYCLPQFDPLSSLCFFSSFHLPFHSSLYYSLHPSNVLVYFHFTLSCAVPSFLVFSSSLQPPCVFSFPFHHSLLLPSLFTNFLPILSSLSHFPPFLPIVSSLSDI